MHVVSVNVSRVREVEHGGRTISTGIFKQPVTGRIAVECLGLHGDEQADLRVHGGVDKAVYAYPHEHYATWSEELGDATLTPGRFGENLTVEGRIETEVRIGDRLRIGDCVLEVSQPRSPCYKLAMRMGRPGFGRTFLASGRVGFYLRVIRPGGVAAGDPIEPIETDPASLSVAEVSRLYYLDRENLDGARRAAALTGLSPGWREEFARRLTG